MAKDFDSEFMTFMNNFLKAHPEVVEDQKKGWGIYWNPHGHAEELPQREREHAPAVQEEAG
jgi:hypothetical protein